MLPLAVNYDPPAAIKLSFPATTRARLAVRPSLSLAQRSGTHCQTSSATHRYRLTVSVASLKHSCSQTRSSVHSALEIFLLMCYINLRLLTYLLTSRMHFMSHNSSATKQRLHPQSVAEISRHSVLSGDKIRQCETSSGSRHKDTDQCLKVTISFCRHRSVPVPCKNGSAETTVAEGGQNPVAGLCGHTLSEN